MKVVSVAEMRDIDKRAQQHFGVDGFELMEVAGRGIGDVILREFAPAKVSVVCGKGNNAGDGFVIAQHLHEAGCDVRVFCLESPESYEGAARRAWEEMTERLRDGVSGDLDDCLRHGDVVVDALLGTGISGAPRGEYGRVISRLNEVEKPVVSVDVPSGLRDMSGDEEPGEVVRAKMTVTVGLPKSILLTLPGLELAGDLRVLTINFPEELLTSDEWKLNWASESVQREWLPRRTADSNKGTWGHVGVIGSTVEYAGAAALAARGALRAGCGLATIYTLPAVNGIYKCLLPEATSVLIGGEEDGAFTGAAGEDFVQHAREHAVLVVGPGMGQNRATAEFLLRILNFWRKPIILDADGLNLLSHELRPALMGLQDCLITPHPGEMARLFHTSVEQVQANRAETAREVARMYNITVLLKGTGTVVARPDGQTWLIPGAEPALAKGGTGDVLAGVIAGLFSQGMPLWQAAVLGATAHLRAGKNCARLRGSRGVLAGEVADEVPHVLDFLETGVSRIRF